MTDGQGAQAATGLPGSLAPAAWPEALAGFPARVRLPVQWGDQDMLGHVNNVVYFRWFESARMVFFEDVGFWSRDGGQPEDAIGPILAGTSARYKAPVYFPDTVIAACRAFDVQVDRFTLDMAMWSEAQGRIVATGEAHIVAYDYRAKQKAALPGPVKARLQPGG